MGFIKCSDGDTDHIIDRVFDDVDEMLEEIVKHTEPDGEPSAMTAPAELSPAEDTN